MSGERLQNSPLPRSGGEGGGPRKGGEASTPPPEVSGPGSRGRSPSPLSHPSGSRPSQAGHEEGFGFKIEPEGALASFIWFKCGGPAEWLVRPESVDALSAFLRDLDCATPVMAVGLGSNLIVRDGGVPGVVVRLPKSMAGVSVEPGNRVRAGGGAPGIKVASAARDAGIDRLSFLSGIPGTVGGAVRMNAGAYGEETGAVLVEATLVLRDGTVQTWPAERFGYTYRHSELPGGAIVVEALFQGTPGDPVAIGAEMERIAAEREATQPTRTRTGGSTFKNPPGDKAWRLIDAAGCRGLTIGDAQVSEKHCNFLLNLGNARSADIEALGEEVRRRVKAHSGVELEWEIQRVGVQA
jgi:UDP-N-acetylmuramate dehydrogenase